MRRLIGFVFLLVLIAAIALIGYSYSGYLTPEQSRITQPVELDVN